MAFDITNLFPEIKNGNKYNLVATNHFSKLCAKVVVDHDVEGMRSFWNIEVICRFGFQNIF